MINKELFENIMKYPLVRYNPASQTIIYETQWFKPVCGTDLSWYKKCNDDDCFYAQMKIDIYRYLYKCKVWALSKDYEIVHMADATKIYKNKYEVYNVTNLTLYCLDNFFNACDWILNQES